MTDDDRPALAAQRDVESVYGPAEDSRLLAETVIEREGEFEGESATESPSDTGGSGERRTGLDVGTGSGYVAARLRDELGVEMVGCDLNPKACVQARDAGVPVVRGDMVDPFADDVFDLVVCNPPYLPTPPDEEWGDWMEAALSGGEDGRAVVDPFLEGVRRVLKPDGVAYLLISTLTGPAEVRAFAADQGLASDVVAEESHPFEKLLVLELEDVGRGSD